MYVHKYVFTELLYNTQIKASEATESEKGM